MIDTWEEDIKYITENSSRVEKETVQGSSQLNYYDEHDNLVLKKYWISKKYLIAYINIHMIKATIY